MTLKNTVIAGAAALALGCAPLTYYEDITMHPRVQSAAAYLYLNTPNEWVLCLGGQIRNDTLHIERAELPQMYVATPDSVQYVNCDNKNYIGTMHPHHSNIPVPSVKDAETWVKNGGIIHIILVDDSMHVWRVRDQEK